MQFDTKGWLSEVEWVPSPNFNDRPEDQDVSLLVIHNISLPPGQFGGGYVQRFFKNQLPVAEHSFFQEIKELKVSAHFLIERSGKIIQFVPIIKRAWHAGVSEFEGRKACNDFSVGIEMEGTDFVPFTSEQYASLTELTKLIQAFYPEISNQRIAGHSDIAPGRKTDPGPCFDWANYRQQLNRE